jgi:type I restriction enzyme, S subunit
MSEWKVLRLGEVADIQNGYAFKSAEFADNGVPIIKIKNIVPPVIVLNEVQYYKNVISQKLKQYLVKKNDFLISMTGSTVNQMASAVGKMSRYQHEFPSFINQRVAKIYSTSDLVSDDYLFYYLNRYEVQYDLALTASGSANQANISPEQLKSYKISFPDLPTQKSITEILSSIDDKIELNNKINQELETLAQTLFEQWFIDFEFPNENGEPYKSSGGEMVDSEFGEIPKGWSVNPISDVLDFISGYPFKGNTFSKNGKYSIVTIKNVQDGKFSQDTDNYINEMPNKFPNNTRLGIGDILMSLTGNVGRVCFVTKEDCLLNQRVVKFNGKQQRSNPFWYYFFRRSNVKEILISISRGTAQLNLSPVETKSLKFALPPQINENLLSVFIDLFNQEVACSIENNELIKLRDSLLPKLISGELEINEISN